MNDESPYKLPLKSRATRSFAARSKSSVRGFLFAQLPSQDRPRQIIYESNLERRVLLTFLARHDLADIWDQPPSIEYPSESGGLRRHTPDFLVTLRSGVRLAIAVKPAAAAERLGFRDELSRIRSAMPHTYADELLLVRDTDLNDADVRNAELLHIARQTVEPEARKVVGKILAGLQGTKSFAELQAEAGMAERGWAALICAIHDGEGRVKPGCRINSRTLVYPRGVK